MLDLEQASPAIDPASGGASDVPLAYYDRASSSWKTSQGCLFAGSGRFSGPWPGSGSMRSGQLYAHPTFRPRIAAPASSLWHAPTSFAAQDHDLHLTEGMARRFQTHRGNISEQVAAELWPTATAQDAAASGSAGYSTASGRHPGTTLTDAVRQWPTPNRRDGERWGMPSPTVAQARIDHPERSINLEDAVSVWVTPQAGDSEVVTPNGSPFVMLAKQVSGLPAPASPSTPGNPRAPSRVLNARWVLTLMGFPATWLDGVVKPCARRATPSCPRSPRSSPGVSVSC